MEERVNAKSKFPQPGITNVVAFSTEEELRKKIDQICDKYGLKAAENILAVKRIEKPDNAGLD